VDQLHLAVIKYGTNWKVVAEFMGEGFTPIQCVTHWRQLKNPTIAASSSAANSSTPDKQSNKAKVWTTWEVRMSVSPYNVL
jgi:hypothetical protein